MFSSFLTLNILFISFFDNHDNARLKDVLKINKFFINDFRFRIKEVARMLDSFLSNTLLKKIEISSFNNY